MDAVARVSSKGQITIPRAVREALGIRQGDAVLFRVDGEQVVFSRIPDLIESAGMFEVPADKRGLPWKKIREETRRNRAAARQ